MAFLTEVTQSMVLLKALALISCLCLRCLWNNEYCVSPSVLSPQSFIPYNIQAFHTRKTLETSLLPVLSDGRPYRHRAHLHEVFQGRGTVCALVLSGGSNNSPFLLPSSWPTSVMKGSIWRQTREEQTVTNLVRPVSCSRETLQTAKMAGVSARSLLARLASGLRQG